MWTAKIKEKEVINEQLVITVDFTDGAKVLTEICKPQDEFGFTHWVSGRLKSLNGTEKLITAYNIGEDIVTEEAVKTETAEQAWLRKFYRLEQVQKLVDLGVIQNDNPKLVALRNELKTTLVASYIDNL